jgi:hypothetical protein
MIQTDYICWFHVGDFKSTKDGEVLWLFGRRRKKDRVAWLIGKRVKLKTWLIMFGRKVRKKMYDQKLYGFVDVRKFERESGVQILFDFRSLVENKLQNVVFKKLIQNVDHEDCRIQPCEKRVGYLRVQSFKKKPLIGIAPNSILYTQVSFRFYGAEWFNFCTCLCEVFVMKDKSRIQLFL